MRAWHEDPSFWERFLPTLLSERRLTQAPEQVDGVCALAGLQPGARVLDLCCGMGRHSLELARRGFSVTGVDRTEPYLRKAEGFAAAENLQVEWVHDDMRAFRREGAFDAAISLYSSFGYFEEEAEELRVLENVHASLLPGGRIVMETAGKEVLARTFCKRTWSEEEDGVLLLQEHEVVDGWRFLENRWIFLDGNRREEFRLKLRPYSGVEISDLLHRAGFSRIDLYGGLDGVPYDENAKRLVAVAIS